MIRLTPGTSIGSIAQNYDLSVLDQIPERNVFELQVNDLDNLSLTEAALSMDPDVLYYEVEGGVNLPEVSADPFHLAFDLTPNPQGYKDQLAYLQIELNLGGGHGSSGGANADSFTAGVKVAVLDTGADLSHPYLYGRLSRGYSALTPGSEPEDLPDGASNVAVGHGTMIAGLIARIAPEAVIIPVRIMNGDGTGTIMNALKGIQYAVSHHARVINMSFGADVNSIALQDALNDANDQGVLLVASAGNDGNSLPHYPASYQGVIGVASVEPDNTLSPFSDYGQNCLLVAPGDGVTSTYWDGGFATWAGTSFSAAFVSAEAAAIMGHRPTWRTSHVERRMLQTADSVDPLNPGFETELGFGIIDVSAALKDRKD